MRTCGDLKSVSKTILFTDLIDYCFILQVDPCKEAMKGKMSPIEEKPSEETK